MKKKLIIYDLKFVLNQNNSNDNNLTNLLSRI